MKKLSAQEEQFCLLVSSGTHKRTSDALRAAYKCKAMSDKTAMERASRLLKRPPVEARMAELRAIAREVAETEFAITSETKLRWLKDIVEDAMKTKTKTGQDEDGREVELEIGMRSHTGAISAIDQINKMDGGHAAQKHEVGITQADRVRALKEKRK